MEAFQGLHFSCLYQNIIISWDAIAMKRNTVSQWAAVNQS